MSFYTIVIDFFLYQFNRFLCIQVCHLNLYRFIWLAIAQLSSTSNRLQNRCDNYFMQKGVIIKRLLKLIVFPQHNKHSCCRNRHRVMLCNLKVLGSTPCFKWNSWPTTSVRDNCAGLSSTAVM